MFFLHGDVSSAFYERRREEWERGFRFLDFFEYTGTRGCFIRIVILVFFFFDFLDGSTLL